jgi:hypothetical protein
MNPRVLEFVHDHCLEFPADLLVDTDVFNTVLFQSKTLLYQKATDFLSYLFKKQKQERKAKQKQKLKYGAL